MKNLLHINNVSKKFGPLQAVDKISFDLSRGEILGFLGPNGAGKTTTMRMITGFLKPTSGKIEVSGYNNIDFPKEIKKSIGYVPEGAPLYGEMTAIAFLDFISDIRGIKGKNKARSIDEVINLLNLESVLLQQIDTFSKGYKRRIGLAQALIHDPDILILDEPTDGLDPNQKSEVRQLILKLGSKKAIIISTHILEEVSAICNRVMIIDKGKLLVDGSPQTILSKSTLNGVNVLSVKGLKGQDLKKELVELKEVKKVILNYGKCYVYPNSAPRLKTAISKLIRDKSWELEHFSIEEGSLEEVFKKYTSI